MSSVPRVVDEEVIIQDHGKIIMKRYFLDPDGKTRNFLLWGGKVAPAIVLPVTTDRKVIALRIFRRAANKFLIEIPGGNPVDREPIEDCVRRELYEETGYTAEKIIQIGPPTWLDPASCFTPYVPFLALGCQKIQEQELSEVEIQETMKLVLVEIGEWFKMIWRGEISDSKTLAVTFIALPQILLYSKV